MILDKVFDRFVEESPVSVMFRGTLEYVLSADRLNKLFEETAERQYTGKKLLFSVVADLMGLVVCKMRKSVNAAYVAQKNEVGASVKAVYNKLAGIEPAVSAALVNDTASRLVPVVQQMKAEDHSLLPGFPLRIVDGNHLAGTEHRIKELRKIGAAALPGQAIAILDPQVRLVTDVILCEDGHANERTLLNTLLEKVEARQCWIADRNFCTMRFLRGIAERLAFFIIRHHLGSLRWELVGKRRKLGRITTGMVYEQAMRLMHDDGSVQLIRRITVELDKPTRDKETEIHVLSNLPPTVKGRKIAELYSFRWRIETAFQDLATVLRSEVNTLGYPGAALFGFCVGLLAYNMLSVVKSAVSVAHQTAEKKKKVSAYYLADEIAGTSRGMEIAIPAKHWTAAFANMSPKELATTLLGLAKKVPLAAFSTYKYSPKTPQPKRKSGQRGNHVSTYQILQRRRAARK